MTVEKQYNGEAADVAKEIGERKFTVDALLGAIAEAGSTSVRDVLEVLLKNKGYSAAQIKLRIDPFRPPDSL